jgi:biopolymer transport protein ExbB/TolQ
MSLTELLRHVGIFGGAVIFCLALLSVFSVAMIIDKHRRFSSASRESEKFKPEFKKFLHGGDVKDLIEAGQLHQNSYVAQVVSAGIIEYDGVGQSGGDPTASFDLRNADSVEAGPRVRGHDRLHCPVRWSFRHRGRNH